MEYSIEHYNYEWVRFKVMIEKNSFEIHYGQLKEIHRYPNNSPHEDIAVVIEKNNQIVIPMSYIY